MERERVRYVMVGSMAMAANGLVRATRVYEVYLKERGARRRPSDVARR